jgi:hypothetical protein
VKQLLGELADLGVVDVYEVHLVEERHRMIAFCAGIVQAV